MIVDEALQALDTAPATTLTKAEIIRLVNHWIGVTSGYLGYPDGLRFTYATHDDFWLETCGIVADTYGFEGTTRECFIDTLGGARAEQQADALEAILNRFPGSDPAAPERPHLRTPGFEAVIRSWIRRLRSTDGHVAIALASASDAVRAALADAEKLGAPRAVDRVHTAMHSYLHQICADGNITSAGEKPTMARLLKAIRNEHPALADLGPSENHVTRVLQAMGTILDALNPIRNDSSAAHPMNDMLDEPEAELVCNSVRTLLRYLERRFSTGPTDRDWPATGDQLRDEIVVARPQEPASTDGPA